MWNPFKKSKTNKDKQNSHSAREELTFANQPEDLDVQFVEQFNQGGGNFLYCKSKQNTLENLKKIIDFEKIQSINCLDNNLKTYLNTLQIQSNQTQPEFYLLRAAFLIAYDGSIMVTNQQTKGRKLQTLGNQFIILAKPSQIKMNSSEALASIKSTYQRIPSYISCIKLNEEAFQEEAFKTKKVYLLLEEDGV